MIVNLDGNILRAWSWGGAPTIKNPAACEQDDGKCVELSKIEHDSFNEALHLHKFDFKRGCVVNKETGKECCQVESCKKAKNAT